jgi:hypothetical protein
MLRGAVIGCCCGSAHKIRSSPCRQFLLWILLPWRLAILWRRSSLCMSCYCRDEVVLMCPVCLMNGHSNTSACLCACDTRQHRTGVTTRAKYLMALWTPGTSKPGTEMRQGSRRRLRKAMIGEETVETQAAPGTQVQLRQSMLRVW